MTATALPATTTIVRSSTTNLVQLGASLTTDTHGVAADSTNGNSFANDGGTWLWINGGTAGGTLTLTIPVGADSAAFGQGTTTKVYTIGANGIYALGPFPTAVYGNTVTVTASVNTIKLATYNMGSN